MNSNTCGNNLSAWSCRGLIAHFDSVSKVLSVVDQTVPISDPFYLQILSQGECNFELKILEWNSEGKYLLTCSHDGSIEIFGERTGLVNRFESLYKYKSIYSESVTASEVNIISSIWCENKRKFSWNSSALQNSNNPANSFINSKSIRVDFVPPDSLAFMLVHSEGLIEIFIESIIISTQSEDIIFNNNSNNNNVSLASNLLSFTRLEVHIFSNSSPEVVFIESVTGIQKSNGNFLFFAKCSASYGKFWKTFELGKASTSGSFSFGEQCESMISIENENTVEVIAHINAKSIEKFIWTTTLAPTAENNTIFIEELELVHLYLDNDKDNTENGHRMLTVEWYTANLTPITEKKLCKTLPFACKEIFYSSGRWFLSKLNGSGLDEILMINLSDGQVLNSLTLKLPFEIQSEYEDNENDSNIFGPLIISPNGCCIGKVYEIESNFPRLLYSFVDDLSIINLNNITVMREIIGKIILSTLNNTDCWDIFRVLSHLIKTLQSKGKGTEKEEKEKEEEEEEEDFICGDLYSFLSTLLSEWISLLEISGMPPTHFYGKLYEMFKSFNLWDSNDVLTIIDTSINFLTVKSIISAALLSSSSYSSSSNSVNCFEEIEEKSCSDSDANLFDFNFETNLQFDPEIFIPLLPILEKFINFISETFSFISCKQSDDAAVLRAKGKIILLLILNDEIFKQIPVIFSLSNFVIKKLNELSEQRAFPFYRKAGEGLQRALNQISGKVFKIIQIQTPIQTQPIKLFENFLLALRNDPQIQPKCSKNLFLFLIDISFDQSNGRKLFNHVLRIFSRYCNVESCPSEEQESVQKHQHQQPLQYLKSHLPILEEEEEEKQEKQQLTGFNGNNYIFSFFDSVRMFRIPIKSCLSNNNSILICRRCHRATSAPANTNNSKRSRAENIYSAGWQKSIWKSRCQCGGMRRLLSLKK